MIAAPECSLSLNCTNKTTGSTILWFQNHQYVHMQIDSSRMANYLFALKGYNPIDVDSLGIKKYALTSLYY